MLFVPFLLCVCTVVVVVVVDPASSSALSNDQIEPNRFRRSGNGQQNCIDWSDNCSSRIRNRRSGCSDFDVCCQWGCEQSCRSGFRTVCDENRRRNRCVCVSNGSDNSDNSASSSRPRLPPPGVVCGAPIHPPFLHNHTWIAKSVGGNVARRNSWPWQVELQRDNAHHCGAVLIAAQYALTAAHCFYDMTKRQYPPVLDVTKYKVVLGLHERGANRPMAVDMRVMKIQTHVDFRILVEERKMINDIALIKLERPVRMSDNIGIVCLPQHRRPANTFCVATGWGETESRNYSDELRQVELKIQNETTCNSHYGPLHESSFCAGESGRDVCQGDSGGPLVCPRSDGVWELQGLVSFGSPCNGTNKSDAPGVYVNVAYFKGWIRKYRNLS